MNYVEKQNKTEVKVPAEVYSRVAGYFRPVNQWNKGKQEEQRERQNIDIKRALNI